MRLANSFGPVEYVAGAASIILVYSSQAIYNNIEDVESDRVNSPDRPLVKGSISMRGAWAGYAAMLAAGMAIALWLGIAWGMALLALLGFVYSRYTKKMGILSYATLTCSHICIPMLIGYSFSGAIGLEMAAIIAFVFATEFMALSIKDYKDVEGDSKSGMRTLPVQYGVKPASQMTAVGLLSSIPVFWLPWQAMHLSVFFLVMYGFSGAMRVFFARKIVEGPTPLMAADILKKFRLVLLAEMFAWCIA